jgi:1-acyl-sn-glycerol-3-phosphate acyltransferase
MNKVLRVILGVPYSIYAYTVYVISMLLMFFYTLIISVFFSSEKSKALFFNGLEVWSAGWMGLCGIRYTLVDRKKHYLKNQPYVMVCNHFSFLDMMVGGITSYPNVRVLAKAEIKKIPFFSKFFGMVSVFVDRKSKESREQSRIALSEAIKQKNSIWIFPEGTRNRTNNPLKEFYDGAFKIAIEQQVPVLPLVTTNSRFINRMGTPILFPGKFEIHFLEPISTVGLTEEDIPALRDKVFHQMKNCILENDRWFSKYSKKVVD